MSWSYLKGKRWAEVTRDERFFCQRLYTLADADPGKFVGALNSLSPGLLLPVDCDWEVGFEVCFFRDLKFFLGEKWESRFHYSPKRTFDLCLFSERNFVVIEAKAQQGFESDLDQLDSFNTETTKIAEILGSEVQVSLLALASTKYLKNSGKALEERLKVKPVSWRAIAAAYSNDPILLRADEAYEQTRSGLNNSGFLQGEQLLASRQAGLNFYVGRGGGLRGAAFQQDVLSGSWRDKSYQTNLGASKPNDNWFTLADFAEAVLGKSLS